MDPLRAIVLALPPLPELQLRSGGDPNRALVDHELSTFHIGICARQCCIQSHPADIVWQLMLDGNGFMLYEIKLHLRLHKEEKAKLRAQTQAIRIVSFLEL